MKAPKWYLRKFGWIPKPVRQVIVLMIGGTILLIGLVMVVAPGPALLVVPLGLAILALEFAFAARWLLKIRRTANGAFNADEHSSWPARYLTKAKVACVRCWHRLRGRSAEYDAFGRSPPPPRPRPAVPRPHLPKTTEPTAPTG